MLLDGTELGFTYPTASATDASAPPSRTHAWKDGGSFGFHDLLDTINPLQHIPIVGAIYRWATGDEPGDVARVAGDTLYGGPIGLAAGLFSVALKEETGKDPGETVMAALTGSSDQEAAGTATAQATAPSTTAAAASPAATSATTPSATAISAAAPAETAPAASTSAADSPTTTASAAITSTPSHADAPPSTGRAPMPLFKPVSTPMAVSMPGGSNAAEQAFLAQNAALQRTALGARSANQTRTFTAPVPLQLTGNALRPLPPRPAAATSSTSASDAAPQPTPDVAIDVPQRMIDALDKYMQMQKQMPPRGGTVDLSN